MGTEFLSLFGPGCGKEVKLHRIYARIEKDGISLELKALPWLFHPAALQRGKNLNDLNLVLAARPVGSALTVWCLSQCWSSWS